MQRLLILFVSIASFASAARAQPAGNPPPAEPPSPSSEPPTAPTTAPPDTAKTPDIPPPTPAKADELPKRLSVGKESPGAYFSPGLLLQGWFQYDETTRKAMTGDVSQSTSTFRIRRLEISAGGEIIPKLVRYRFM